MIGLAMLLLGLGSTEFSVTVRDAATGKPVEGAFVVAREFTTVGKFHGSTTYETRLDLRRSTQSAEDRLLYLGELALGLACGDPRWSDRGREGVERLASAMVAEAQALARNRYEKSLVEKMKGWLVAAREMKPDHDAMPMALQAMQPLGLASGFARDFIVGDPDLRVSWDASRNMAIAAMPGRIEAAQVMAMPSGTRPGQAAVAVSGGAPPQAVVVQPKTTVSAARIGPVIHCRHGPPSACDLNERDAQGATALQAYVTALKVAEVKALLEAGADPSIPAKPSNVSPIEALIERLARTQPETGTAREAMEILEMLAAQPRVTLPPKLREDLAADPVTWTSVQHSPGRTLLIDARPRLLALAPRSGEAAACEPLGYVRDYGQPPVRLRYP